MNIHIFSWFHKRYELHRKRLGKEDILPYEWAAEMSYFLPLEADPRHLIPEGPYRCYWRRDSKATEMIREASEWIIEAYGMTPEESLENLKSLHYALIKDDLSDGQPEYDPWLQPEKYRQSMKD